MAVGISSYAANALFNAIGNNTSFAVATCYVQLHIGDPGAAGTSNTATETTRKAVSFGAAASGAILADYYAATVDEKGFLKDGFSGDGLHPNARGYELMAPVAASAIRKALQ